MLIIYEAGSHEVENNEATEPGGNQKEREFNDEKNTKTAG